MATSSSSSTLAVFFFNGCEPIYIFLKSGKLRPFIFYLSTGNLVVETVIKIKKYKFLYFYIFLIFQPQFDTNIITWMNVWPV